MATPEGSHGSIAYRPELDGLRAVAVVGVLAQHLNIPNTTLAGMVGVNLFFVLSGYLITSILLNELKATGRIALRPFYERRLRRLLPALVAMLVVTGVVMALQGRLVAYLGPALVSLFYVSDIAKAAGYDLGYVGHTWSLAMEEQFYLLWPAVLLFLPRRLLVPVILTGIVGAVALQITVVGWQDKVLAHFRPDVRADAILWGCLIAIVPVRVPRWAAIASAIALVVLSLTFLWPYALGISAALSAMVVAGAAWLAPYLSWRPLVRIGQISYGLYLWHFLPVGLFMDRLLAYDVAAMVAVTIISFGLALASERWIERPFRLARPKAVTAAPGVSDKLPSTA